MILKHLWNHHTALTDGCRKPMADSHIGFLYVLNPAYEIEALVLCLQVSPDCGEFVGGFNSGCLRREKFGIAQCGVIAA